MRQWPMAAKIAALQFPAFRHMIFPAGGGSLGGITATGGLRFRAFRGGVTGAFEIFPAGGRSGWRADRGDAAQMFLEGDFAHDGDDG